MTRNRFLESLGHLALGSRLKRLGTLLQAGTQKWLHEAGCDVPSAHMPLLAALEELGPSPLGALVDALGISQPGVSRMVASLAAAGWIRTTPQGADRRIRRIALTAKGRKLVAHARRSLWPVIDEAVAELCADLPGTLTEQLTSLEEKLSTGAYEKALAKSNAEGTRDHDAP